MIMQRCCRPARKEEGTGKGHRREGRGLCSSSCGGRGLRQESWQTFFSASSHPFREQEDPWLPQKNFQDIDSKQLVPSKARMMYKSGSTPTHFSCSVRQPKLLGLGYKVKLRGVMQTLREKSNRFFESDYLFGNTLLNREIVSDRALLQITYIFLNASRECPLNGKPCG